jgi:hypothetical protein
VIRTIKRALGFSKFLAGSWARALIRILRHQAFQYLQVSSLTLTKEPRKLAESRLASRQFTHLHFVSIPEVHQFLSYSGSRITLVSSEAHLRLSSPLAALGLRLLISKGQTLVVLSNAHKESFGLDGSLIGHSGLSLAVMDRDGLSLGLTSKGITARRMKLITRILDHVIIGNF